MERDWEGHYVSDDLPWDADLAGDALKDIVVRLSLQGRALEVGCGTGAHALWLAQNGFDVVGLDVSATAIARAITRFEAAGIGADLRVADFLQRTPVTDAALVFDRGVFHCMAPEQRDRFAQQVAACLASDGVWITMAGNADEETPGQGPPRLSAAALVAAIEPRFHIQELSAVGFGPTRIGEPLAWRLVARPRL